MPPEFTAPGVYVEEIPLGSHEIAGVPTSIAAFVGSALRGPTDKPTPVQSWNDFESTFGPLDDRSLLGYAVFHFFANGGQQAYVLRLADPDGGSGSVLRPNTREFERRLLAEGLDLLDRVDLFNLLCVPGETTPSVIQALQKFCRARRAFLIVDCDEGATFDSMARGPDRTLTGFDGINSALYFPWIKVPSQNKKNRLKNCPPCGFVAGLYARTDTARGVWKPPAGSEATLSGVSALKVVLNDDESGVLHAQSINCIRNIQDYGNVVWGARTLHGAAAEPEWKYIPVRRLALFIEESLYRGTEWVVFEPNNESLWTQIRSRIGSFMRGLFFQQALQGARLEEAYFVKCNGETTTQNDVDQGIVNILVGFAPLKPAEFVIIRIQQIAGQIAS